MSGTSTVRRSAAASASCATAQGASARPAEVAPWPVVFTCYWPGSSSSVANATHGMVGMPPWTGTLVMLTLVIAAPPHAVRLLSIAIAQAQPCLPVFSMLTLSGV